jgi:hypothetical protein
VRLVTVVVVLLLALGQVATAANPGHAAGRERSTTKATPRPATFGIGPASSKGIDGRPYLTFLTAAGARLDDHLALINFSGHRLRLRAYAVDAANAADGSIGFAARSARPKDAGAWISLVLPDHRNTVTLAPHQTLVVPVHIAIPANAQPGDHVAGIVASLTSLITNRQGRRVNFEQRVALRTFFRIGGVLRPSLSIDDLTVISPAQWNPLNTTTATVHYTVRNTGNVRLSGRQLVTVTGLFHTVRATAPRLPLLFPGGSVKVTVRVHGVYPQFRMTVRVTVKPLTVLGDVDTNLPATFEATKGFWLVPWTLVAVLALLIIAVVGYLVRRRQRRKGPRTERVPSPPKAREEQHA